MSDVSPMGISWPDEFDDPFHAEIEETYIGVDRIREDEDCVMVGGGTVTLVTNTLTWTGAFYIYSPRAGTFVTIAADSITIADGNHLYFTPSARPIITESSSFGAGTIVPAAAVWCGTRSGSNMFFRSANQKQNALTGPYPGTTPTQGAMSYFSSINPTVLQQSSVWVMNDDTIVGYKAVNDANPYIEYGSSATDRLRIQDIYDTGAQTLKHALFETVTTGSYGDIKFSPAGDFIVKASSGGKIFSGTNSSDVEKASIDENGYLTLQDGIYEEGKSVEVTTKNKHQVYILDSIGEVLIYQSYYWTGTDWSATQGYSFGHFAGQNCSKKSINNFGYFAGQNCSGDRQNNFGYFAGRNCSSEWGNNYGFYAGSESSGSVTENFGYRAGEYCVCNRTSNFGGYAGRFCLGDDDSNIGYYAGNQCISSYTTNIGKNSGQYMEGNNNIAIGFNAWSSFLSNTSGNKTFDNTDIDAGTDNITIAGHGFGSNGTYQNVLYTEGTSPIPGITNGNIIQLYIVDANTVNTSRTHNITAAGSGTGHTLTPQYEYTNTTIIGANQNPTASNQVILGSSSVTDTILRGTVSVPTLKTGTHNTIGAETVTGYITIKDSGGTDRKIAIVS